MVVVVDDASEGRGGGVFGDRSPRDRNDRDRYDRRDDRDRVLTVGEGVAR